ncbi:MAG: tRNA (adenosine(37)-N6)-threonylcarbamoyltransferase complex transferase subunit TsaD [Parachlamydiales bacterium]|nr:tRNA (adenosine(37)-N6)-threonylcarbamoyltransferase complex transferase subunit TsaD [Verrucomicrobiota bacterium]MBX3720022.1 tRNA (adenosine(37)-N6)-threonylcarbamoyltransferase complex transferase subunit TsaD [Candidatus Acheromyda pituitae]
MIVLGIESTCDETACAIVRDGHEILSSIVSSQIDLHEQYGGVFPELACRRHIDTIIPVIEAAMKQASITHEQIDLIAVAKGPGLIGALLIGLNVAKALSLAWGIPFIGVNHVEAHIYAAMMHLQSPPLPGLGVVISGGHTFMVKVHDVGNYTMIGTTLDDAVGEAFDKVASMLGLPYPGGPAIEKLAKDGNPKAFPFKAGKVKGKQWDFSFSGLKTNVLYTVKGPNTDKHAPLIINEETKRDIAASFQDTALQDIVTKSLSAADAYGCQAIFIGGGVSNNLRLRDLYQEKMPKIPIHFPEKALSLDNAAMIAGLGFHCYKRERHGDPMDLEPMTRIPL